MRVHREMLECPLLANNGLSGHVASTSALLSIADLRGATSAFPQISSASPPRADLYGDAPVRLLFTQGGH